MRGLGGVERRGVERGVETGCGGGGKGGRMTGTVLLTVLTRCHCPGSLTFVTPDGEVTASAGDLMSVPPGAIHTFKNTSETEDCECYMTATPGE